MPRLGKNSMLTSTAANTSNRNGQLKLRWSILYELDMPGSSASAKRASATGYNRTASDELGALLDKALAFAG